MKLMRSFLCLAAVLGVSLWVIPVAAEEGGYEDTTTELIWSPTWAGIGGAYTGNPGHSLLETWQGAQSAAAAYAVLDYNDSGVLTNYNDWRVPTVKELQKAISDGSLLKAGVYFHGGSDVYPNSYWILWSSESHDSKRAWAVKYGYDANGNMVGGDAVLILKTSDIDVQFVRADTNEPDGR